MKILELYKKYGSISKVARTLNLSKGVVHKYVTEHKAGRLDISPLPSPQKTEQAREIETKPVRVNIHEFIDEHTLKTLHILAMKEDFKGIDDCVKGLISLYINIKAAIEQATKTKFCLKEDKEIYIPGSSADYWFGYSIAAICSSAIIAVASFLGKKTQISLKIAQTVVNEFMLSQEFLETHAKEFRIWYDQHQDIMLTAKAKENILSQGPRETMSKLADWVARKTYPKAKAMADIEPEE
jgi:hypothetical protein